MGVVKPFFETCSRVWTRFWWLIDLWIIVPLVWAPRWYAFMVGALLLLSDGLDVYKTGRLQRVIDDQDQTLDSFKELVAAQSETIDTATLVITKLTGES